MLEDKLIPSFQQIPYTELVKRIDAGSNGVLELSNMLHERKDLHEKTILFELKMSKANIFQHEIPTSTSERMLGFFKNLYIFVARSHIKTHKEFNDSVLKELDDLKNMRTSTVNRTKQLVNNGLRDIQMAEEALEKAKKAFNKAKHDYERSVDKLKNCERAVIEHQRVMEEKKKENAAKDPSKFSMGRMFQSAFEAHPEQDRDKQIKKVERRSDEMIHAANLIIERKRSLLSCMDALDRYLQEAAAVFQELEVDRMRRMKSMMRRFCEAERAMLKAKEEQLTLLEESISYQEPEEDMLLFITQEKLTEATHKYGGAVKLLDEFLYRRRQPEGWSFTTCDEYKIVDHAQLISALIESVEVPLPASTTPTAAAAGGASLSVDGGEGTQRLAEYDTMDTPVGNLTAEEILNEERQSSAAVAQAAESNSKAALPVSPVTVALECIFNGLSTLTDASSETPVSQETDEAAASHPRTMTFQQWEDILQGEEARDLFLQVLDDKRCVSACLDEHGYTALAIAMQAMLSYCEQFDDTKRAMRVLNMSNTFYHPALGHEGDAVVISVPNDVGGGGASGGGGGVGDVHEHGPDHHHHHIVDPSKQYLQADPRLKKHPIWRKQNFWENALKEGVFVEMEKLQPSNWDELSPEGLKESVINIHNLVFGQLGTLSLTMREQSCLEKREVASHVLVMSRKFQLCEDQEYDLLHSITGQSIKEYQPPPIIPNAPLAPHDGMDGDVLPVGMNNTGRHSVTAASLAAAAGLAAEGSRSDSNDASTTLTSRAQRHSINAGPSGHVRPASVVVDGTATVITATNGGNSRRSSRTTDAPVVVNATVVTSNSDTSPTPVQAQPRGSHSSSNPFSFMLGGLSGGGGGGGESSGKRSRTASHNSHDDYYATL